MLAVEDSASIFWAREIRGTMSMATTLAPLSLQVSSISSFWAGQKKLIRVWPWRSRSDSSFCGSRTLTTTSACSNTASMLSTIVTPASS